MTLLPPRWYEEPNAAGCDFLLLAINSCLPLSSDCRCRLAGGHRGLCPQRRGFRLLLRQRHRRSESPNTPSCSGFPAHRRSSHRCCKSPSACAAGRPRIRSGSQLHSSPATRADMGRVRHRLHYGLRVLVDHPSPGKPTAGCAHRDPQHPAFRRSGWRRHQWHFTAPYT